MRSDLNWKCDVEKNEWNQNQSTQVLFGSCQGHPCVQSSLDSWGREPAKSNRWNKDGLLHTALEYPSSVCQSYCLTGWLSNQIWCWLNLSQDGKRQACFATAAAVISKDWNLEAHLESVQTIPRYQCVISVVISVVSSWSWSKACRFMAWWCHSICSTQLHLWKLEDFKHYSTRH